MAYTNSSMVSYTKLSPTIPGSAPTALTVSRPTAW